MATAQEMTRNQQLEQLNLVKAEIEAILERTSITSFPPLIQKYLFDVSIVNDEHSPLELEIGEDLFVIFDNIRQGYISEKDEHYEVPGFLLQQGKVIPGVRTFRNGDPGYPDDYEYVDIDTATNVVEIAQKAVKYAFSKLVDNAIESIAEDRNLKREEQYEDPR